MIMNAEIKRQLADTVRDFHMPRYSEIPNVGLYLEQTAKYISEYLAPLQQGAITGSMIGNYVKKGLVASPVKKQYSRDQVAYLMFIALAKNVLSLDNLIRFIQIQQRSYTTEKAYNYLCDELENMLGYVFGLKDSPDKVGEDSTDEKFMLRATIVAIAHKLYLDKCFDLLSAGEMQ